MPVSVTPLRMAFSTLAVSGEKALSQWAAGTGTSLPSTVVIEVTASGAQ